MRMRAVLRRRLHVRAGQLWCFLLLGRQRARPAWRWHCRRVLRCSGAGGYQRRAGRRDAHWHPPPPCPEPSPARWMQLAPLTAGVLISSASWATALTPAPASRSPWIPAARWPARRSPRSVLAATRHVRWTVPARPTAGVATMTASSVTAARAAPASRWRLIPAARWPARRSPRSAPAGSGPARSIPPEMPTAGAATPPASSATTARPAKATCRSRPARRRPLASPPFPVMPPPRCRGRLQHWPAPA